MSMLGHLLAKIVTLLSVLMFTVWVVRDPSWPSVTMLIASLSGLIGQEVRLWKRLDTQNPDKTLFAQFLKELPSDYIVGYLSTHDFGGDHELSEFNRLDAFLERWQDAEHEFIDEQLEMLRKRLIDNIRCLRMRTAKNVFRLESGRYGVLKERRNGAELEWQEIAKELNRLGDHVVETHQQLVSKAKKRLWM